MGKMNGCDCLETTYLAEVDEIADTRGDGLNVGENSVDNPDTDFKKIDYYANDAGPVDGIKEEAAKEFEAVLKHTGGRDKIEKSDFPLNNDQNFKNYIEDIESQTHRKIPENQIELLKDDLQTNEYGDKKGDHRKKFNERKVELRTEWERNTGQKWPEYTQVVRNKRGKVIRYPGSPYDAHEIIPNKSGGPIEWYNIHPAKHPTEHQEGIHRKGGVWQKLFEQHGDKPWENKKKYGKPHRSFKTQYRNKSRFGH